MSQLSQRISRWLHASGLLAGRIIAWKVQAAVPKGADVPLGLHGELMAAKYLKQLGYRIVVHGHRQRMGEIDLIALDGDCVVFVEVKTWASDAEGDPSLAVDRAKQEKITRAALIYLKQHRLLHQPARFDVVSVVWTGAHHIQPKIRHFKNAFEAVGTRQFYS